MPEQELGSFGEPKKCIFPEPPVEFSFDGDGFDALLPARERVITTLVEALGHCKETDCSNCYMEQCCQAVREMKNLEK